MGAGLTTHFVDAERALTQFPTLLIAATAERYLVIQEAALATREVLMLRNAAGYPSARDLTLLLNHTEPELVILDALDPGLALNTAEVLRKSAPGTPLVIVGARGAGRSDFGTAFPPAPEDLALAIYRSIHAARGGRNDRLLAFVPAKAGCGASTIALHTAAALQAAGKRVLLIDADLHSGSLGAMVQTSEGFSLQQVLRGISELDKFRLEQAVRQVQGVDLLLSDGTAVTPRPGWEDYFRLLDVAGERYDAIVVDLPEVVNPATQEFIQRARNVYLVTTQEMVPLRMVQRRREELDQAGAPADSVRLLVNRWLRWEADAKAVEQVTRHAVFHHFDNDYRLIRKALTEGTTVAADSGLGRSLREFAFRAMGLELEKETGLAASLGGLLRFAK